MWKLLRHNAEWMANERLFSMHMRLLLLELREIRSHQKRVVNSDYFWRDANFRDCRFRLPVHEHRGLFSVILTHQQEIKKRKEKRKGKRKEKEREKKRKERKEKRKEKRKFGCH